MAKEEKSLASAKELQASLSTPSLYPGFKFSPTDEELISYYLRNKMDGFEKSVEVIPEIDICRHEPWDLPDQSIIPSENEWFFFSSRGRKYPNGSQSRRATELGYWKATGKERNVKSGTVVIGTKRTLVFHTGRAPKGERTEWIMHEFCIDGRSQDAAVICRLRRNAEFRLTGGDSNRSASAIVRRIMGGEASLARKSSSSYDSHSVEQLADSATESNEKVASETAHAESSSRQKDFAEDVEVEEDFYADILKDDIIKLDESSPSAPPVPPLMHGLLSPPTPVPSHGVVFEDETQEATNKDYNASKDKNHDWSWSSPTCLLTTSFPGKTVERQVSAIIAVIALLGLAVFLLGGLGGYIRGVVYVKD